MDYYNLLYKVSDTNMILDNINEIFTVYYKNMFSTCHGRYHAMFVVDTVEYILKSLSYDARTVELGKVAALLHDTGMITGRWKHAKKSAALSSIIFDGSDHLAADEKKMLVQAIEDHSKGANISSAVGAALLIADKVDISKKRILPVKTLDAWHKNLLEIDDVIVHISGKALSINYIVTEAFSKELLISEYEKGYKLPIKAAKYLGCTCHFLFNGVEERLG